MIACIAVLMLLMPAAHAQTADRLLEDSGISSLYRFAQEQGVDLSPEDITQLIDTDAALSAENLLGWVREKLRAPARELLELGMGMLPPMIMLVLMRATLPKSVGGTGAVVFMIRLQLTLGFAGTIQGVISQAARCLEAAVDFSNVLAPVLTALMAATGQANASALISPASALAVNIVENVFLKYGIPLCKLALCCGIAGNLSKAVSLRPVFRLLKKAVNWGTGLAITIFTALLSLQSGMVYSADGVALRTAKYAVDSAGGIIGSGISDAWDTYITGMAVARKTVGVSGIAILIGVNLMPVLYAVCCMLMLKLFAAAAEILAEKETASMIDGLSGVCQMTVSLLVGGMAAVTILITAAMGLGGGLLG